MHHRFTQYLKLPLFVPSDRINKATLGVDIEQFW